MTPVQMSQLFRDVECVLHAPGNLTDHNLTEMAIILDYQLPCEVLKNVSRDVILTLKKKGDRFRNVRLNVIKWVSDEVITNEVMPLSMLAIGKGFEDYGNYDNTTCKHLDILAGKLKQFYARSKLMILITDGNFNVYEENAFRNHLQPFLHKKWIWVDTDGNSKGRVSRLSFDVNPVKTIKP